MSLLLTDTEICQVLCDSECKDKSNCVQFTWGKSLIESQLQKLKDRGDVYITKYCGYWDSNKECCTTPVGLECERPNSDCYNLIPLSEYIKEED